jgi:signal transduction histidine kinase
MAREALSNAVRHAHATRIILSLQSVESTLVLAIEDDGVGFEATAAPPSGHLGLANLRQRAIAIGGELTIDSTTGGGTRIRILVPQSSPDQRQESTE